MTYIFQVTPIGKPRMTQRDKWSMRLPVLKYYKFKDQILLECRKNKYKISNELNIEFFIPFPKSYSNKKKEFLLETPHTEKPDLDNLLKTFMDCLTDDDKTIHTITAKKIWNTVGFIKVNDHKKSTSAIVYSEYKNLADKSKMWIENNIAS